MNGLPILKILFDTQFNKGEKRASHVNNSALAQQINTTDIFSNPNFFIKTHTSSSFYIYQQNVSYTPISCNPNSYPFSLFIMYTLMYGSQTVLYAYMNNHSVQLCPFIVIGRIRAIP